MSTNRFLSFMVIFVLSSCSSFDYNKVIQNKKILLRKIENTSLVHRNSNIIFTTYNRSKANNYYLKEKQGIFIFENDSIEYSPNLFSNISKQNYQSTICKVVTEISQFTRSLGIRDYSSDFHECCGVNFKFYLEGKGVLLYVTDIRKLNGSYLSFLRQCEVVDKNWYFSTTDWQIVNFSLEKK